MDAEDGAAAVGRRLGDEIRIVFCVGFDGGGRRGGDADVVGGLAVVVARKAVRDGVVGVQDFDLVVRVCSVRVLSWGEGGGGAEDERAQGEVVEYVAAVAPYVC